MSLIVSIASVIIAIISTVFSLFSIKKAKINCSETRTILKQNEMNKLKLQNLTTQFEQLNKKLINIESTKTLTMSFYNELKVKQNLKIFNLYGFIALMGQGCIEFVGDDIKDKFNSLINCHHMNFWASDKSISPLGQNHFYIMVYYNSDKVAGYQMFFTSQKKTCQLFEVYVVESLRNLSIASNLIESSIGFCSTQLEVNEFTTHLLKQKNRQRSLLVNVFERMKELYPRSSFNVTVEESDAQEG